jgi:hypothetical protein
MTWMERFEETIKTPVIATCGWFECMTALQRDEAHRLDANGAPALGGGGVVLFDDTEFVVGVFHEAVVAEQIAASWNQL